MSSNVRVSSLAGALVDDVDVVEAEVGTEDEPVIVVLVEGVVLVVEVELVAKAR